MDCKDCKELIGRYLADALDEMQTGELRAHIAHCEDCAREEAQLRQLIFDLGALGEDIRAPESLMQGVREAILHDKAPAKAKRSRRSWSSWRIAGAAAAAVAVVLLSGTLVLGALGSGLGAGASQAATAGSSDGYGADDAYVEKSMLASAVAPESTYMSAAEVPAEEGESASVTADSAMRDTGAGSGDAVTSSNSQAQSTGEEYGLKIIRTAEVYVHSDSFDEDRDAITALVQELGGYITSQHTSGTALEPGENGYGRSLGLTVRIPSDSLDAFLSQSEGVGVVQESSIYEEDVTDQYFDTERRLEGYQTQYDRILALMDKAETVDELISIESELNRIYYQIESLTGSLQSWDARVNYSTVYYNLEEVRRASPVSLTLWERMQVSLQNTWDSIVLGSQNFVVWLYGALPALGLLLVLAGVAGLTVALCLRRHRRRAKAPKEEEPADGDKRKR